MAASFPKARSHVSNPFTRLVRRSMAESGVYTPNGYVSMVITRLVAGEETQIEVTAPFWIISPSRPASRDRGGNWAEVEEPGEVDIGEVTNERDVPVKLTPSEDAKLRELAVLQAD